MGYRQSANRLLCQCCRLALPAPTALLSCPALAILTGQQLPTLVQGVLGVMDVMEKNTRNVFFSLQAEKEVSHLDMYSSQAGKGTRHWEKRSRGLGGTASPRGCETDGRFGSGVVTERPASFFRCKSTQHNTARGLPAQPGRFAGGSHPFKHAASKRQHQRCFMGNSALEKGCLGSGGKWEGRQRDCLWLLFTSLPSLHTGPHSQAGAQGRAGSP